MNDEPDNLILVYLRRMDEKLDRLTASVIDIGRRVTCLETKVVLLHGDFAAQSKRIDRVELRFGTDRTPPGDRARLKAPIFPSAAARGSMRAGGHRP